jgi:ketosteroid isomerase-like protein
MRVLRRVLGFATVFVAALAALAAQGVIPPDLAAMAETEREFAKAATVKGWRDAFLDFFADDSIAFAPEVVSAKDRLRKQPSTPFSEFELVWEPRTGDVASSGDLGWLTGPSTSINHKSPDKKPSYGCYLSVWRKQADGRWRVFIDVGASAPEPVPFAPGFTRTTLTSRYAGARDKASATASLADSDRTLNARIADRGIASAFDATLAPAARLHRAGLVPITGRESIVKWLGQNAIAGSARDIAAESSAAGDFGYTYGTFEIKEPTPVTGVYVRLWNRDEIGRWWLMVDVGQTFKK